MEDLGLRSPRVPKLILGVGLAALAARIAAIAAVPAERAFYPDAREYVSIAKHLLAEGAYVDDWGSRARRPPLYPWFLALHGGSFAAARWTQALLGAAACALAALLGLRLSARTAWIAGLACAAHPLLAFVSVASMAESVWVPFALAEVLLLVEALERGAWKPALAAGVAGGLATLGQAGHQLAFAALGLGALVAWRGSWRTVGVYAAAALVVPGLWMARNAAVLGGFAPVTTKAGLDLVEAFSPTATGGPDLAAVQEALGRSGASGELDQDRRLRREALGWIAERPGRAVGLAFAKEGRFWSPVPNYGEYRSWPVMLLTAAALAPTTLLLLASLAVARRWPKPLVLAALAVGYEALLHAVFIGSVRYRLAVEPFVVVVGAWVVGAWVVGVVVERVRGRGAG